MARGPPISDGDDKAVRRGPATGVFGIRPYPDAFPSEARQQSAELLRIHDAQPVVQRGVVLARHAEAVEHLVVVAAERAALELRQMLQRGEAAGVIGC